MLTNPQNILKSSAHRIGWEASSLVSGAFSETRQPKGTGKVAYRGRLSDWKERRGVSSRLERVAKPQMFYLVDCKLLETDSWKFSYLMSIVCLPSHLGCRVILLLKCALFC